MRLLRARLMEFVGPKGRYHSFTGKRLPTTCALISRNINVSSCLCPMCGELPESAEHLFVSCGLAQSVWQWVSLWCKIPPIFAFNLKDLLQLFKFVGGSEKYRKAFHAVCLTTIWYIWKVHNGTLFNDVQIHMQKLMSDIKSLSVLWVKSRSMQADLELEGFQVIPNWKKKVMGTLNYNHTTPKLLLFLPIKLAEVNNNSKCWD
ncbi:uncharacterized protein LOC110920009 [Helianthus annuus]|uniref:uncharacterized protein LOC110920009 n=1 Tax=Helianthus annuus TaxID=4232 RepID=UPI000B8F3957|nr:uncharacterized protein LOC110920009 [Helianthus annuus]